MSQWLPRTVLALLAALVVVRGVSAGSPAALPLDESAWFSWSMGGAEGSAAWAADETGIRIQGSGSGMSTVLYRQPFAGQFDVSVGLDAFMGHPGGVILVEDRDGKPDPDNWVAIERYGSNDRIAVRVYGMRDGQPLEIEPPHLQETQIEGDPDRLRQDLNRGIIRLRHDTPRLRVLRNTLGGALHFQFADHRVIDGEMARGWSELPTADDRPGAEYFFGVYAKDLPSGEEAVFNSPTSSPMPLTDQDPADMRFGAKRRGYTWSGYHGDAVVISFDDRADRPDAKFVFWSEANFVPWWHLDDRLALSYEFVEIWGGDTVGCNEPMSDHLLRWTRAKIVESSPVRVVVQWDYTLITSDYRWWNNHPTIRPTVRETYTFYSDGVGVRKVRYRPPLEHHETFHKWGHELAEIMPLIGGGLRSDHFVPEQALSVFGLQGQRHDYTWDLSRRTDDRWNHQTDDWLAVIIQNHFKGDYPSPFIAFAQDERVREFTAPTVPIQFGSDWELNARPVGEDFTDPSGRTDFGGFSHWPIMKQPYDSRSWIGAVHLREPRHIALISITSGPGGYEWPTGPKERTFAMLIGLGTPEGEELIKDRVRSWLYPGEVRTMSPGFVFEAVDYYERAIRFRATRGGQALSFGITPEHAWVNPVIIVDNWSPAGTLEVSIAGQSLDESQYVAAVDQDRVIVWIDTSIDQQTEITIRSTEPDEPS